MDVIGGMAKDPKASESAVPWPQSVYHIVSITRRTWQLCVFLQEPTCHAGSLLLCPFSFPFFFFLLGEKWRQHSCEGKRTHSKHGNGKFHAFGCWMLLILIHAEQHGILSMIKGYSGTTNQCHVGPFCLSISFLFSLSPVRNVELAAFQYISIPIPLSLSSNTP